MLCLLHDQSQIFPLLWLNLSDFYLHSVYVESLLPDFAAALLSHPKAYYLQTYSCIPKDPNKISPQILFL